MKILYLELKATDFYEDYSCNPKYYGGGPCFARWAKELMNDSLNEFWIVGPKESFRNLKNTERRDRCIGLDNDALSSIRNGISILNFLEANSFDIICHHHTCMSINKNNIVPPVVHWSGFGRGDAGHPNNDYILLYTPGGKPVFGEKYKYIKIGKPVPKEFVNIEKEDFIFQCSRHDDHMNTNEVVDLCNNHKVRGYFAGPIHNNYPILSHIDNKHTFYIGSISEEIKLEFTKRARMTTYLHNWDTVFNQSVIESWGVGTPILANNRGFFSSVLKDGVNGYFFNGQNFLDIYNNIHKINQKACWESAKNYSVEEMIESFKRAFEEIVSEWQYEGR